MACQREVAPPVSTEGPPVATPAPVISQQLTQNCDLLAEVLTGIPGASLTRSIGRFEDSIDSTSKQGCLLKVEGSFKALGAGETAEGRIGRLIESRGWQFDNSRAADGPDGTVFAFSTPTAWCLVTGRWDGGDDSDPTYVPDDAYDVTVGCAAR